jgi:hypothetical protein
MNQFKLSSRNRALQVSSKSALLEELNSPYTDVHLTMYLNRQPLHQMKKALDELLSEAEELMIAEFKKHEIASFLKPIVDLRNSNELVSKIQSSVALFRTKESFRMISLPTEVKDFCVVASSFHVKPLIKWQQTDSEFFVLGLGLEYVTLYSANMYELSQKDKVIMPTQQREMAKSIFGSDWRLHRKLYAQARQSMQWAREWVEAILESDKPLFLAGDPNS